MGSSRKANLRNEARLSGRMDRALASALSIRLVFGQIQPAGVEARHLSFLIACRRGAQDMLDDGFDPLVWPSALLLNVVALSEGN